MELLISIYGEVLATVGVLIATVPLFKKTYTGRVPDYETGGHND